MHILLAAATAPEIAIFLEHYRKNIDEFAVDIDVLITGVGLTASTYSLTKQISIKRPDMVIQAGIAGCFDGKVPLGKVVTVKQDRIADEGVFENEKLNNVFDLGLTDPNQAPYKNGWLMNKEGVSAITVNQVSTNKDMISQYQKKYNPVIETMEGAALHYVCLAENIPFLQLRAISNYIGERDKKKWKIKEAITSLNKELIDLLMKMK